MRRVLAAVAIVLGCSSFAHAQGSVDAESLYLGPTGGTVCRLTVGSGAPSSGATCDTYLDTATGDLYTKRSGTWTVIPRLAAANVWTVTQAISNSEPALALNETDQGSNLKLWRFDVDGAVLQLQTLNDAGSSVLATVMTVTRGGNTAILGGLTAGSGAVGIIDTTGKIPAISSTYFASLSGANLTAVPASVLTGTTLPAAIVTSSLTTVGALNAGSITSGFGAIDIGADNVTAASFIGSGTSLTGVDLLASVNTHTAFGTHTWSASGTGTNRIDLANPTAGTSNGARFSLTQDEGIAGIFVARSSTFTTSGFNIASGVEIEAVRAGGLSLAASNAAGNVRIYSRNALAATFGASQALTLTGALNVTGISTHTANGVFTANILPTTNYTSDIGALSTKFRELHAAELWVETLVAQSTMATIGGRILVAPTNTLTADFAAASTTLTVKYNNLANGDRIYLESNGKLEWIAIASLPGGSAGAYTYTVTRNLDGSGANDWFAGDAAIDTGTTGNGFIDIYSTAGVLASGTGPTIVGNVRTGTTYNNVAPRWAIGNLDGLYGYSGSTYGAAFGDNSNAWIKIDTTNGIRIGHNATTKVQIDASGNASFTGTVTAAAGSIGGCTIAAATITCGTTNDIVEMSSTDATYRLWAGNATAASAPFSVTKAGLVTATSFGQVTFRPGTTASLSLEVAGSTSGIWCEIIGADSCGIVIDGADVMAFGIGGSPNVIIYPQLTSLQGAAFGTGNVGGSRITMGRNTSGSGAAGVVAFTRLGGTTDYTWSDNTGVMRTSTSPPEEDGTPSDTSGTVIGTQTSTRASKTILGGFDDNAGALALLLKTPIYRFVYKSGAFNGTEFVGITTDDSPAFGMDLGRSFNPVSAFGYTVGAVKALNARIIALEAEVQQLKAGGR